MFYMAYDREEKKKLPRFITDIQEIEDRLSRLQQEFRDIRVKMRDNNMPSVELAMGTFLFLLEKIEPLAKKYAGQLEEQLAVMLMQRKKAEKMAAKEQNQNRSRK